MVLKFKLPGLVALGLLVLLPCRLSAGEVHDRVPAKIDPGAHYVFYMHGMKFGKGETVFEDDLLGVYDHTKMVASLKDPAYHLIAYIRPPKEEVLDAARQLSHEVQALLGEGVPPEQITLVGFSGGGMVVVFAASILERSKINVALLAGCGGPVAWDSSLKIWGRVFSLYDDDDTKVTSCKGLAERSEGVSGFKEVVLKTEKGHSLFFDPSDKWLPKLKEWISQK